MSIGFVQQLPSPTALTPLPTPTMVVKISVNSLSFKNEFSEGRMDLLAIVECARSPHASQALLPATPP